MKTWTTSRLTADPTGDGALSLIDAGWVRFDRDASGSTVTAQVGEHTIVRQLTAGDGCQVSNERRVIIGIGEADVIGELTVRWPSEVVQTFPSASTVDGVPGSIGMLLAEAEELLKSPPSG